ncbi:molybdopterin-binding protein [Novosphingobium olei]|uniref:molybdopterin-binding protein n=1 Tax=Novosphingobium olei TaxID=2728851 RepID=UPI00308BC4B0|nr:molybdopterin-binding protein [Novosphingobium olei]
MTSVQLLDKSEIWLHGVSLDKANLPAIAAAVAGVLGLPGDKVFVTDVRPALVVLDILSPRVNLEDVTGRQADLLAAVAQVPGVSVAADASVHSEGILGVIGTPREEVEGYLAGVRKLERQIADYAARRVAVVSTGSEVLAGEIEDTNFAAIREAMTAEGFEVEFGGIAGDSEREIAGLVARLSGEGFGVIVTTGGVGAEDKDHTIEALEQLDRKIATAVLAMYSKGHGRHVKDSVRIAIARIGWSLVFALPGPTHEVKLALPVILRGLADKTDPDDLVEAIARPLRATLPQHNTYRHHHG